MEVALLSHQSMVVAPQLYPHHEISQCIEVEALGPPELLPYVRHVIHWASLLDAQSLLLVWEEVGEEFISRPYPFHLLIGGNVMPFSILHYGIWQPTTPDHGTKSSTDGPIEVGYLQVL